MYLFLSKTIDFFLMPVSWLCIGTLYALFTKYEKRRKKALWMVVIFIVLMSNGYLSNIVISAWENPRPKPLQGTYDVAIVLSGDIVNANKVPTDSLYGSGEFDRVLQPLLIYKRGQVRKILITGGRVSVSGVLDGNSETPMVVKTLLRLGVKPEDIIAENKARNTHENAVFTAKILREQYPNQRYLLFTSAYHMRRSEACFKKEGIAVQTYRCDLKTSEPAFSLRSFLPSAESFYWNSAIIHEIFGYYMYKLLGYC